MLIPKADKPLTEPSSFRPLCMLDTGGKVFEEVISGRLEQYTEGPHGLSDWQFGFRKGKSTIDAADKVCNIAKAALEGTRWLGGSKEYCVVVTLDVKNAFNSAEWGAIIQALAEMRVPPYLINIVKSYFKERYVVYDTEEGAKIYEVSAGVPQGSVLGPVLWNAMYNGIFLIDKPEGVTIVGYADDIAIVAVAKQIDELRAKCEATVNNVKVWLQRKGLELAEHKTEMVLLSSRKRVENITIRVGDHLISSQPEIKYLGILIDHRLSFRPHLLMAGQKALRVSSAIARILPNTGGPRLAARQLLASVSTSTMMYGDPIWYSSTRFESYTRVMVSAHRISSLRVCCAFRTVSSNAASVIAGRMPVNLLAKKAAAIRNLRASDSANRENKAAVESILQEQWQDMWDNATNGRWTHSLIPNVKEWLKKKHGEPNYYMTQFLSGHGCFREYLFKYRHVESPFCLTCEGIVENAEHVFIECIRFTAARSALEEIMNEPVTCSGIVTHMTESKDKWQKISHIIAAIMLQLRHEEREARQ